MFSYCRKCFGTRCTRWEHKDLNQGCDFFFQHVFWLFYLIGFNYLLINKLFGSFEMINNVKFLNISTIFYLKLNNIVLPNIVSSEAKFSLTFIFA